MPSPRPRTNYSAARRKKAGARPASHSSRASDLHLAADDVRAHAIFGVILRSGRYVGVAAAFLPTHAAGLAFAVVHLRVNRDGDLVRQIGRAQDEPGELFHRGGGDGEHAARRWARAIAGLYAHLARNGVE